MASLIASALLGLGCLGLGGLVAALFRLPGKDASPYLYFMGGASLIFCLALLGAPPRALVWLLYLGLPCLAWLVWRERGRLTWPALWPHGLLLLVLVPLIIAVLYTPLIYWDARSIWFYQGKLLFFNHGLYSGAYPPPFSPHPDYPKFIPVFSALTASLSGLWNEYLPKAALMVPLAAMWLGVAGLSLSLWAKLAVLAVMVLLPGASHHVGYMDGWLAVFCALGHLYFIDYGLTGRGRSLACALVSLCGMMYLKNEGLALAGISLAMMALVCLLLRERPSLRGRRPLLLLVLLALAPVIIWGLYVHYLALENDLFAGEVMERLHTALANGAPLVIWRKVMLHHGPVWLWGASLAFNGLCYGLSRRWRCPFALSGRQYLLLLAPWLTSLLYAGVFFLIYLVTPADLEWHIWTSASRVVLPGNMLLVLTMILPLFLGQPLPGEAPRPARQHRPQAPAGKKVA